MYHVRFLRINIPSSSTSTSLALIAILILIGFFPSLSNGWSGTCYVCAYVVGSPSPQTEGNITDDCANPTTGDVGEKWEKVCEAKSTGCAIEYTTYRIKGKPSAPYIKVSERKCTKSTYADELDPEKCLIAETGAISKRAENNNSEPIEFKQCFCKTDNCNNKAFAVRPSVATTENSNKIVTHPVATTENSNKNVTGEVKIPTKTINLQSLPGLSPRNKKLNYTYLFLIFASVWV